MGRLLCLGTSSLHFAFAGEFVNLTPCMKVQGASQSPCSLLPEFHFGRPGPGAKWKFSASVSWGNVSSLPLSPSWWWNTPWLLLLALLAWGNLQHIIVSMLRCGNKDLRNSGSTFLRRGAVGILTSSCLEDNHHGGTKVAGEWKYSTGKEIHVLSSGFLYFNICFDYYFSHGFCTLLFAPS